MTLYFAPDQDCLTPLLEVVNNARRAVTVADYSFSCPQLTDALIAAHQRGVAVRIVLDRSQSAGKVEKPEIAKLQAAGVDFVIRESDKHRIMHLKVLVGDDTVAFGSYNFTNAAALENNVLAVYESAPDALLFTSQIQKIYDQEQLTIERIASMDVKRTALHALRVFAVAFGAVLVASGFNLAHLPALADAEKLGLAAVVAGADAVYEQVLLPLLDPVANKLGL